MQLMYRKTFASITNFIKARLNIKTLKTELNIDITANRSDGRGIGSNRYLYWLCYSSAY